MDRPNILVLLTDQQRWDALGANGNIEICTPNLDRLAAEGLNCDQFFVQSPVCMPSRVSMLSGLYPATLGILRNGVPVPEQTQVLPHLLRNYGYHSANIGKLHFLPHANRDHRDPHPPYGFDHLEVSDEPGCYEDAYRAWVRRKAPAQLDLISVGLPPATHVWYNTMGIQDAVKHPVEGGRSDFMSAIPFAGDEGLTHSAFVAEQTMGFLEQQRDQPFLCIAGFYSPHAPWVVPQSYLDLYDPQTLSLPSYPAEIEGQRTASFFPDEQLRSARHGYYAMVSCAGIPIPYPLQGRSFLSLLENRPGEERSFALTEGQGWKTLRTDGFRYVIEANGREALYDLRQDPNGYRDVVSDPACASTLAETRRDLLWRLIQRERPLPRVWAY